VIKHIVFWKLKPSAQGATREENARKVKSVLEAIRGKVPGMRLLEVGINFETSDAAWDVALYSEFDTRAALDLYQEHPAHLAAKDFIKAVRDTRAVVDYEA
jgi:hypothetical protein